ncbi:MAG: hypothetical protein JWR77_999 [Rhizorhabdus sp.]|nr:hypothetical protein [Rhizorhabdus sp.]
MANTDPTIRIFATLIAAIAWLGLAMQFATILASHGSIGVSLWIFLRFFTISTNLAIAILFTIMAAGRRRQSPRLMAGISLAILLVGIVYGVLLQGQPKPADHNVIADLLLHKVTPVLVPLFWLCCVPKGAVRPVDPLLWALYPFGYLFYALARGLGGDRYAYFFIDPATQGWGGVAAYVAVIALGFILAGYALFWADRRLRPAART